MGRIDSELAARGLARSRSHGANLVEAGRVLVDGKPAKKASQNVSEETKLRVLDAIDYVSRAGHKLAGALDHFGALDIVGRVALDVGASTGGFTDVCLRRGVAHVIALDVGHDQIAEEFRGNPRVSVIEGFNARDMSPDTLKAALGVDTLPAIGLVVADLSFISLTLVLEQMLMVAPQADFVLLVKPQFEAGKESLNAHGIVTDHRLRVAAIEGVASFGEGLGLRVVDMMRSSLPGTHGNIEYVLWMSATEGEYLSKWKQCIAELAKESK